MRYDGEENNLQRTDRENAGTWVDWLQKSMEVKSYKSVSKMLQLSWTMIQVWRKIQEIMK